MWKADAQGLDHNILQQRESRYSAVSKTKSDRDTAQNIFNQNFCKKAIKIMQYEMGLITSEKKKKKKLVRANW